MAPRIEIHEIAARDLQVGDMLSTAGVNGLDNWYHTDEAGEDVKIVSVATGPDQLTGLGEYVIFDLGDGEMSIETPPDIRVTITRPWSPSL